VSSSAIQLEDREWAGEIHLKSNLKFGNMSLAVSSTFATEEKVKNPSKEDEHGAEKKLLAA
jgi:hypothetical protein